MKYKVCINCHTYNHSHYIYDALNGFIMQKTNFPYIVMLVDDSSTDGEQKVIADYVSMNFEICAQHRETDYAIIHLGQHKVNKNCYIVIHYLKYNHYQQRKPKDPYLAEWGNNSDYEAICEGDDYWTDPYKLQKQVDFLEANPEYSMCFANAIEHWEDGTKEDKCFSNVEDRDYTGVEIYENWIVPTASVLYRKEIVFSERYKEIKLNKNFIFGDIVLFLSCAEFGKLRGMSDVVSVYRRHEGGVTNQVNKTVENKLKFIRHQKAIGDVFGKTIKGVKYTSKKLACENLVIFFIYGYVCSRKLFFVFIMKSFAFSVHLTLFYLWVELKKIFSLKIKKVIQKIKF